MSSLSRVPWSQALAPCPWAPSGARPLCHVFACPSLSFHGWLGRLHNGGGQGRKAPTLGVKFKGAPRKLRNQDKIISRCNINTCELMQKIHDDHTTCQ